MTPYWLVVCTLIQAVLCEEYKIGFLPSMRKGDGRKYVGAFAYAIQQLNGGHMLHNDGKTRLLTSLGRNVSVSYMMNDVQGDVLLALSSMTEQYNNNTVAFIGPEDSCYFEAKIAAAWNLPMIAYKCTDYRISEKRSFPTFARTFAPTDKISKSLIAVLNRFEWRKFTPIASTMPKWQATAQSLIDLAEEMDPPLEPTKIYSYEDITWESIGAPVKLPSKPSLPNTSRSLYARLNVSKSAKPILDSPASMTPKADNKKTSYDKLPKFHETTVGGLRKKLDKLIADTKEKTRVYVFLGERSEFVHFVRQLDTEVDKREYVVIAADHDELMTIPQFFEEKVDDIDGKVKNQTLAFRMALLVTPTKPMTENPSYETFVKEAKRLSHEEFLIPHVPLVDSVPFDHRYAIAVYDAVYVYARALHDVLNSTGDAANGTAIFETIRHSGQFLSISGHSVPIDDNADAEGNFSVLALKKDESSAVGWSMQKVGRVEKTNKGDVLVLGKSVEWFAGEPPKDEPECGFDGKKCTPDATNWSLISIVTGTLVVLLVGTVFAIRHYVYEQKLASLLWKIDYSLIVIEDPTHSEKTKRKISPQYSFLPNFTEDYNDNKVKTFCEIGSYKGQVVAIKRLKKKQIELNRVIKKELQQMKEMNHDNVNRFVGAVVEPGNICIITLYCNRGSLQDILQKDDYKLDEMFKASLINDLIKGMMYLHDSEIGSHGRLKSSNCLVDSRWVLQISGFGLNEFKAPDGILEYSSEDEAYRALLWTAPELLRQTSPPRCGTEKGDVYSFAIILHEITARMGPWGGTEMPPTDIIRRVRYVPLIEGAKPFRPDTRYCDSSQGFVLDCMEDCWHELEHERPDFRMIRIKLKDLYKGLRSNIFDNMVALMEKYSSNLEAQVEERTLQLSEEKKRTETLLHRMLPKSVAEELKTNMTVKPEQYEEVTIYFSDICGFTEMAAESTPMEVVDLLNKLYSLFDNIIESFDVYKIETIGDAYMVVSGVPNRNGDLHAGEIASMSLSLLHSINTFNAERRHKDPIKLRIGMHSGPCVAGVVGRKMPRYCLFGDTVNTSSRMESTGVALKIHCSENCKLILDKLGGYDLIERLPPINVKGKGIMKTYFLEGENAGHRLRRISREKPAHPLFPIELTQLDSSTDSLVCIEEDDGNVCKPLITNTNRRSTGSDNLVMNLAQMMNGSARRDSVRKDSIRRDSIRRDSLRRDSVRRDSGRTDSGEYHDLIRQASTEV